LVIQINFYALPRNVVLLSLKIKQHTELPCPYMHRVWTVNWWLEAVRVHCLPSSTITCPYYSSYRALKPQILNRNEHDNSRLAASRTRTRKTRGPVQICLYAMIEIMSYL
jgi:hypothetical protein